VLDRALRFADLLALTLSVQAELEGFETGSANGRPLGDPEFIAFAESKLGRRLRTRKPGPKPQVKTR
jgi:hypothetical protein